LGWELETSASFFTFRITTPYTGLLPARHSADVITGLCMNVVVRE